jgi:molybdenum cofactor cytidylyltransferase
MSPYLVTAIVLAAGKSTRMGAPKQMLPLGDTTILGQTLAHLHQAGLEEVLLVLGAQAETIQQSLPSIPNLRTIHNPNYQQGMATSLQAGLAALRPETDSALIVLADQPFLQPQTIRQLAHHSTAAQILIPTYRGKRGNPVRLHRFLFPEAMALQGDVGCRALFATHPDQIEMLEVEDEGILVDLDTPEQYQRGQTRK